MHQTIRGSALAYVLAVAPFAAGALAGQSEERPIDRWLVTTTGTRVQEAVGALGSGGGRLFPDRAVDVGPGRWDVVREDGAMTLRLARSDRTDGATLAHAYVKSGTDGPVTLDVSSRGCPRLRVWLNGQALSGDEGPRTVMLADGWNTLLVALPSGCVPELSAGLGTARALLPKDVRPIDPQRLRIQASRPPGVRPNLPSASITVDVPRPVGLVWRAAVDELAARARFTVTSWGGGPSSVVADTSEDHSAPAEVDLTGEWAITLYTPTGIEQIDAELEMSEDGRLDGRLRGERIDGSLRDGWVSGNRFGWMTRWSGPGRGVDLTFEGVLQDDAMNGTLDFGGFRDFEARFDGRRKGAPEPDSVSAPEDRPPAGGSPRRGPPGGRGGRGAGFPAGGFGPPPDTEGQHERIIRQLLPPMPPAQPAPSSGSFELRFDGEKLVDSANGLEPAHPIALEGMVSFKKLRAAALDDRGVQARIAWGGDSHERVGRVSAEAVLEAFHAPIALTASRTDAGIEGSFRVPESLDGFTIRTLGGEWSVDGSPVRDGALCSPCKKGRRLEIRVTGTDEARVQVADPGYPTAAAAGGAGPAEAWLRALSDDRRRYREMGVAGHGS